MNKFFRNFILNFDRSFSKGLGRQLAWLVSFVVLAFVVLMAISLVGYSSDVDTPLSQRCTDVLSLMIDPGDGSEGMFSPFAMLASVVGMTEMGRALATNAAHVLHFPNYREGDPSCVTRITFIDPAVSAPQPESPSAAESGSGGLWGFISRWFGGK